MMVTRRRHRQSSPEARPAGACPARAALVALSAVLALVAPALPARADDFVDRVNEPFKHIPTDKRSDLIVLPLLPALGDPPAAVRTVERAMLLNDTVSSWGGVAEWAQGASQQALLKAIAQVTSEENSSVAMVFAQGYGVEAVSDHVELIATGMYTELGDPPTLAGAKIGYMPALEKAQILAHVEATRLASSGDVAGAIEEMVHWLYFSRQIAERPFLKEKRWGMDSCMRALVRIRDLAYGDIRAESHAMDYVKLHDFVHRLDPKTGYIGIERIRIPTGDIIAADQLLTQVLEKNGGTNANTFAIVMARIGSSERPLRLLSESAFWEKARAEHGGWFECRDMLLGKDGKGGLSNDWTKRWDLDAFDPVVKRPSDYQRLVEKDKRYAVLRRTLAGIDELFPLRQALRTELAGTRISLSVYGFWLQNNHAFPPGLTSIRPYFVDPIDRDPYNSAKPAKPIEFFVPVRDTPKDPRGGPVPYRITVYPGATYSNFEKRLQDDSFVVFSIGPDDSGSKVKEATQADPNLEGDYLLWPPVLSLLRQNLIDNGRLQ